MPHQSGFDLLNCLGKMPGFDQVPKLVLSSSGMESDRQRARELGACAYFVKPNQLNELVKLVYEIDENWITEHCAKGV
jgi:DNA-binding response OmpR family regulator